MTKVLLYFGTKSRCNRADILAGCSQDGLRTQATPKSRRDGGAAAASVHDLATIGMKYCYAGANAIQRSSFLAGGSLKALRSARFTEVRYFILHCITLVTGIDSASVRKK